MRQILCLLRARLKLLLKDGKFFMQEYMVIIICMTILLFCGVLKEPCKAAGLNTFKAFFVLLCAGVLAGFNWRISVEVCINAGAAAMIFIPVLLARGNDRGNGVLSVVVFFAALSTAVGMTGWFYGSDNGLLCGLIAGFSSVMLAEVPDSAVFSACAVPVFADIAGAFVEMASTGYASLEINNVTLTAQLIALAIAITAVWLSSLSAAAARAD